MMSNDERRRLMRIQLGTPIVARIGTAQVVLLDISAEGARIEHRFALSRGKDVTLRFEYGELAVQVVCTVVRSKLEKRAGAATYCSGVLFGPGNDGALAVLRDIIADAVSRDFEARRQHILDTR